MCDVCGEGGRNFLLVGKFIAIRSFKGKDTLGSTFRSVRWISGSVLVLRCRFPVGFGIYEFIFPHHTFRARQLVLCG